MEKTLDEYDNVIDDDNDFETDPAPSPTYYGYGSSSSHLSQQQQQQQGEHFANTGAPAAKKSFSSSLSSSFRWPSSTMRVKFRSVQLNQS